MHRLVTGDEQGILNAVPDRGPDDVLGTDDVGGRELLGLLFPGRDSL